MMEQGNSGARSLMSQPQSTASDRSPGPQTPTTPVRQAGGTPCTTIEEEDSYEANSTAKPQEGVAKPHITKKAMRRAEWAVTEEIEPVTATAWEIDYRPACLFIPGKMEGRQLCFLIDSGCSHSLLSKTVFDKLPARIRECLIPQEMAARMADKSGLPLYGRLVVRGKLSNVSFTEEFLVSKISDEAILDMSFMQNRDCTLICN